MRDAANGLDVKQNNRNRIYRAVYEASEPMTKQGLAQQLHLSLPTVTMHLNELIEEGFLMYSGTLASTGGRKARALTIVKEARVSIGMSLTDRTIRLVAIDLGVNQLSYERYSQPFEDSPAYYEKLSKLLETFLERNGYRRGNVLGVGIALPGIVQEDRNTIDFAPTMKIRSRNFSALRQLIPYPIKLFNDASASGFAEWWGDATQRNMAYLSVERGVGGTVLVQGKPYHGDHGRSGEFGHMCVEPQGRACSCGKYGCLEAYCSVSRISDDLDVSLEEFFEMLDEGNRQMEIVWDRYLTYLAIGIVGIRSVLDCDVVLSGMLTPFMENHMEKLRALVASMSPFDSDGLYVRLCRHRSHSGCVGAALHFVSEFMENL